MHGSKKQPKLWTETNQTLKCISLASMIIPMISVNAVKMKLSTKLNLKRNQCSCWSFPLKSNSAKINWSSFLDLVKNIMEIPGKVCGLRDHFGLKKGQLVCNLWSASSNTSISIRMIKVQRGLLRGIPMKSMSQKCWKIDLLHCFWDIIRLFKGIIAVLKSILKNKFPSKTIRISNSFYNNSK